MARKVCFKCNKEKPLGEFYKHPQMADGTLNKCKECNKKDVKKNRKKNIDHYRKYDRERGNRQGYEYTKEYRKRFPNKYKAHGMVSRAVRAGYLAAQPCEICGTTELLHAHHDDYSLPLNVRWLCAAHHKMWHEANGEGKNA